MFFTKTQNEKYADVMIWALQTARRNGKFKKYDSVLLRTDPSALPLAEAVYKKLIAAIIRNRLESDSFPNTISEVILAKGQFSNGDYVGVNVDIETQEAVEEVFSMEESPHPATYYYNPELSSYSSIYWFEYSGDIEHLFSYSEEDWGIVYTTRFFI